MRCTERQTLVDRPPRGPPTGPPPAAGSFSSMTQSQSTPDIGRDVGTDVRNVIIIGSGPAGYTAAIYAARASLHPLVFEGSVTAGGALMNTTDVENFPGFPDGIMGPDLMDKFRAQAARFGAALIADAGTAVDFQGDVKTVSLADGTTYRARAVVLSMGSGYRK